MNALVIAILLVSVLAGDLRQNGESHLHISEGAGNRLITRRIQPTCPDDTCALCEHAEVILKLTVKKSGAVEEVSVVRAGDSRLAEAALNAVKQWRYGRYVLNGSPVEYETRTTIKFWICKT